MGGILDEIVKWLLNSLIYDRILMPFFDGLNNLSTGPIFQALRVETVYASMRSVGFAIFILVVLWQALKSIFAFTGVEADEPAKIIFKAIIMGFALGYSYEILMYGVNIANDVISFVLNNSNIYEGATFNWSAMAGTTPGTKPLSAFTAAMDTDSNILISLLVNIIVIFKIIGIYLRLIERVVLSGFLVMGAPLAFAAGVAQPTKGFFQGFIKVYVGNLIVMILQNLGVTILFAYLTQPSVDGINAIVSAFIALAITKVITKLEDIVRDMSVGVGVGRDMGGALQSIQGAAYSGSMFINAVKSFKGG